MRRRQATAIVLMGVIGAEFQREIEVYSSRGGEKKMSTSSRRLEKLSETPGKGGKNARNGLGVRKCCFAVNSLRSITCGSNNLIKLSCTAIVGDAKVTLKTALLQGALCSQTILNITENERLVLNA